MNSYSNLSPVKTLFWTVVSYSIGFGVSFGLVYWIGTQDLGLCFVIAVALANGTNAAKQELMSFVKNIVPIFQSIDNNINGLIDEKNRLQEQIEELEDKVKALDHRIDDLESK